MATNERSESKSAEKKESEESGEKSEKRVSISLAIRNAAQQLSELLQRQAVSVSSVKATDEGWTANVEVLELEKIPETTSVMASYQVSLDGQGQLMGYEQTRKYSRGQVDR